MSYHLEYVEKPGKFDEVVEQDGVKVLIDSKALFSIIGSEMDWQEDRLRYAAFDHYALCFATDQAVVQSSHSKIPTSKMHVDAESPLQYNIIHPNSIRLRNISSRQSPHFSHLVQSRRSARSCILHAICTDRLLYFRIPFSWTIHLFSISI